MKRGTSGICNHMLAAHLSRLLLIALFATPCFALLEQAAFDNADATFSTPPCLVLSIIPEIGVDPDDNLDSEVDATLDSCHLVSLKIYLLERFLAGRKVSSSQLNVFKSTLDPPVLHS